MSLATLDVRALQIPPPEPRSPANSAQDHPAPIPPRSIRNPLPRQGRKKAQL